MQEPEQPETARRIKAALAYGNVSRGDAARVMDVSKAHLDRFTAKEPRYAPSWDQLWRLADRCGLPPEWFSADLTRIAEIVSEGPMLKRRVTTVDPRADLEAQLADAGEQHGKPRPASVSGARARKRADR